jgi:hypothetical protein
MSMRRLVLWFLLAFCAPAFAEPVMTDTRDVKTEPVGKSGFWTNPYPAKGGAYRWRMMAVGGGLLANTGYVMWRLIRKASDERAGRPQ